MKLQEIKKEKSKSIIITCAKFAGIGTMPNEDDFIVIGALLKNQFAHLSAKFLISAFEVYASGKLTAGKEKIEHYGTFSPKFVGEVIQAYKEYSAKQKQIKRIEPERMLENNQDPEAEQKRAFDFIKKVYGESSKMPNIANWSDAFKYLEREGLINLTNEDKEKLFIQMTKEAEENINAERSLMRPISSFLLDATKPSQIKIECRKRAVIDYLKK